MWFVEIDSQRFELLNVILFLKVISDFAYFKCVVCSFYEYEIPNIGVVYMLYGLVCFFM